MALSYFFLKWVRNCPYLLDLRLPLVAQTIKNLPAMQETQVRVLGWEDPLEKGMATHSNILAWIIPWTKEPSGLPSLGSKRVGHDWATNTHGGSWAHFRNPQLVLSHFLPPPFCGSVLETPSPSLAGSWLRVWVVFPTMCFIMYKTKGFSWLMVWVTPTTVPRGVSW